MEIPVQTLSDIAAWLEEQGATYAVIEPLVYRGVAFQGQYCEELRMGHFEVTYRDRNHCRCIAKFTHDRKPSFVRRCPQ